MIKLSKWMLFWGLLTFAACVESTSSGNGTDTEEPTIDSSEISEVETTVPPLTKPECEINGSVLEENLYWAKGANELIAIVADESTEDPDMGESHRILEVYDGEDCERILRNILPVNLSPDFPYYLSEITYNNVSHLIAIKGFQDVYIFDIAKKQLSKALDPTFLNERYAEDAQSGMIQHLELWENYLIGYATNEGVFVFDLSNSMDAKAVLPAAEFELAEGTSYNSMFFLEAPNGNHQALLPSFDLNTGEFKVNPIFDKPTNIETNINPSFRDNQYLVIKELLGGTEKKPVGIDMKEMKIWDIPDDLLNKKDTELIAWMKQQ